MTEWMDSMGNKSSKPKDPLAYFPKNFDKLYFSIVKKDYDYPITKSHL